MNAPKRQPSIPRGFPRTVRALFTLFLAAPAFPQGQVQRIAPDDLVPEDYFGSSVAEDGGSLFVGAPHDEDLGPDAGSVYVFERESTGWVQRQRLFGSLGASEQLFGAQCAVDGDRAVISSDGDDQPGPNTGALYVFRREPGGWVEEARLVGPGGGAFHSLGYRLALDGDVIASTEVDVASTQTPRVLVFERGAGGWSLKQSLQSPGGVTGDGFGFALALSAETLWIGAPHAAPTGLVRGYRRTPTGYVPAVLLEPEHGIPLEYGDALATDGQRLLVGDTRDHPNRGAAHVYRQVASVWTFEALLTPYDGPASGHFAAALDIEGSRALVGRHQDPDLSTDDGSAYEFELAGGEWRHAGKILPRWSGNLRHFGRSVALAGSEAIVGAPLEDLTGAVHVFDLADVGELYCFCPPPGICDNPDEHAGCHNDDDKGARLSANGSASVSADDLLLSAVGLPPIGNNGLFFMGSGAPQVPFGHGWLCVGGPLGPYRFPLRAAANSVALEGPGILEFASSHFPGAAGQIQPGDTWRFQCWFRDFGGPCGAYFNFTNAVTVTFGG